MSRTFPLLCALAVILAACGGGANTTPVAPPPERKSRLAAFDAAGLDAGLELPLFTNYWTQAEQRNGNVYPVKASVKDSVVLAGRLDAKGEFAQRDGDTFIPVARASLLSSLDSLAQKHWNEEKRASAAALVLFADVRAPYRELLGVCRELVNLRVGNLWLVTRDERDDALRLLPLFIDTSQLGKDWYELDAGALGHTVRLTWVRDEKRLQLGFDWVESTSNEMGSRSPIAEAKWREHLAARTRSFITASKRVQFDMAGPATVGEFAECANLIAPIGYDEVEPFWPALDRPEDSLPVAEVRKLAVFKDTLEVARDLNVPTLSHWWRASAADRGLALAGVLDTARPILAIRATADGSLATRSGDAAEWTSHPDDMGVLQAMRTNAGEIDFDTGLSELQIVLGMDRNTRWETFLGVLEMMKSAGCFRLFVVTNDVLGPTLRLLQFPLPVGELPGEQDVAGIAIEREGVVADGRYRVTMRIDGRERTATGPAYPSSLTQWTTERKRDPLALGLKLPRDEPFETLFTVLNAVAWIGAGQILVGG